jgi:hypothetical protein
MQLLLRVAAAVACLDGSITASSLRCKGALDHGAGAH